ALYPPCKSDTSRAFALSDIFPKPYSVLEDRYNNALYKSIALSEVIGPELILDDAILLDDRLLK
ncbi:hypothetical protein GSQ30_19435, partial [Clostridioides difficile]|nr:hypothetical protein [Clostridioides difficile]